MLVLLVLGLLLLPDLLFFLCVFVPMKSYLVSQRYTSSERLATAFVTFNNATFLSNDQINLMSIFLDVPITSALVCHFVGIIGLYLLQGTINLIGSPAGCRIHHDNKLEGLDMGSYLKRESETSDVTQIKISEASDRLMQRSK